MILEFLAGKLLDEAYDTSLAILKRTAKRITTSKKDIIKALNYHIKFVENWSRDVQFKDMTKPRHLKDLYIDLDIQLTPKKLLPYKGKTEKASIVNLLEQDDRLIILGDPGAGKTTSIKHICQNVLHKKHEQFKKVDFLTLIELRSLDYDESLYDRIKDILGIELDLGEKEVKYYSLKNSTNKRTFVRVINNFLENLNVLVLIDGLDEVHPKKLRRILKEIRDLFLNLSKAQVLVTCRSAAYDVSIDNSRVYEICPLNKSQIKSFVSHWFVEDSKAKKFLAQLSKSPFHDASVRPLTLAHLCALFEKYQKVPDKPKSVYKKIVTLLLEEWDNQRGVSRTSKYSNFEVDRKLEFLSNFAFELTLHFTKKVYAEDDFKVVYQRICQNFGLPKNEVKDVIGELETHTGIIIQSGYDAFEFSHKSIQEYLCAEHIIRLPQAPKRESYETNIFNELAIAVCLSSNPTRYFLHLIFDTFERQPVNKIEEFLDRLFLEKPDFVITPLLGISFFHIYHKYYGIDEDISKTGKSEKYHSLFSKFLKFRAVLESIRSAYEYVDLTESPIKDFVILDIDTDSLEMLGYYNIPHQVVIPKDVLQRTHVFA